MISCQPLTATILNDFPILGDYFWPYQTMCQYCNTSQMADKNTWTNNFHFLLVIVIYITMHFSIICILFFLSGKTDLFHFMKCSIQIMWYFTKITT